MQTICFNGEKTTDFIMYTVCIYEYKHAINLQLRVNFGSGRDSAISLGDEAESTYVFTQGYVVTYRIVSGELTWSNQRSWVSSCSIH